MMLVTGMIIGSAFTLFVVPSIYVLVARTLTATASAGAAENERSVPGLVGAAG
jgi:hypothetical protein